MISSCNHETRPWPYPRYNPSAEVKRMVSQGHHKGKNQQNFITKVELIFTGRILENHIFGAKTKNCILAPFWPFLAQVGQNIFSLSRDQMISNEGVTCLC